jgi:hypothetical protein
MKLTFRKRLLPEKYGLPGTLAKQIAALCSNIARIGEVIFFASIEG